MSEENSKMQRRMSYNILPPLEHLATVRVASLVYNDAEIGRIGGRHGKKSTIYTNRISDDWKVIEKKIIEDLSPFLPSLLQIKVAKVIRPMHNEVSFWKEDHVYLLTDFGHYSPIYNSCLCWKTDGTINREQTTKKLLMNESIDPKIRFITACTYFLEVEVLALWKRIKEVHKNRIILPRTNSAVRFWMKQLKEGDTKHWWMKWRKKDDVKHWSEMIDEYFRNPSNFIEPMDIPLRISSFYNYLSWENKQKFFRYLGYYYVHSDDFRMCMKDENELQRREIFRSTPVAALLLCLRWPFRSRYIEMAEEIMSYLTARGFLDVVVAMLVSYIYDEYEDSKLFEEFWQMSPAALKNDIMFKVSCTFAMMAKSFPFRAEFLRKYFIDVLHRR